MYILLRNFAYLHLIDNMKKQASKGMTLFI